MREKFKNIYLDLTRETKTICKIILYDLKNDFYGGHKKLEIN